MTNKIIIVLVVFGWLVACGFESHTPQHQTTELQKKFSAEDLRADFRIIRTALEEGHAGIYRYVDKGEMDRRFEETAKSVKAELNALEFYRLVAPLVAAIKCGHTRIELPSNLRAEVTTRVRVLPMRVRLVDGRVYVEQDFSGNSPSLTGREIRSINGIATTKLVQTMLSSTPGDGDIQTSRVSMLNGWGFAQQLFTVTGLESPYVLTITTPQGGEKRVSVSGRELQQLTLLARSDVSDPIADVRYFDDGKIARLTIRDFEGFADRTGKQRLEDFLRTAFQDLQSKQTKSLIIDLRNNGGGYDHLGALLLAYLLEKPFAYYQDIEMNNRSFEFLKYAVEGAGIQESFLKRLDDGKYHLTGHPTWGEQQPVKPTFAGKVLVLINGLSFSTTSEFISQAHFHRRASFIGEEAGGGYYGNTAGFMPVLELPQTKLRLRVPLVGYHMAVSGHPRSRGVIPDYPVKYSIDEWLSGKDKDMELALKLAREQQSTSSSSPREVLSSYLKALKSLDHDGMERHWAEKVTTRYRDGSEEVLDREFSRKMRDFEREMKTVWSYKIMEVTGERVTVRLIESNDFYDLLGVGRRTQIAIYYVRDGKIFRDEDGGYQRHQYGDFATRYASFKTWLTKTPAAQDPQIMQGQSLVWDAKGAKALRPWLKRWRKNCLLRPKLCS